MIYILSIVLVDIRFYVPEYVVIYILIRLTITDIFIYSSICFISIYYLLISRHVDPREHRHLPRRRLPPF